MMQADLVLPSLDAALEKAFKKVNAPSPDLVLDDYLNGMITFADEFKGKIWLEVFIIPGYNDDERNLLAMKEIILRMNPDKIQVNSLDRPGTLHTLRPANKAELKRVLEIWDLPAAEIIASVPERKDIKSYRSDVENAIMETIRRRPCTLEDLSKILGLHVNEVNKYLGVLEDENKLETLNQERGLFYQLKKQ
jgi:wyosine [tRNA(Phe)-imidazoG37] synthetase (radical SAM superfamily)